MSPRHLSAALALALATGSAAAQQPTKDDVAAVSAARKALRQGCYLKADEALRAAAFDLTGKPKPGYAHQSWRELQALFGGTPAPSLSSTAGDGSEGKRGTDRIPATQAVDALDAIVSRARGTRLVILNEDHASPRDRAFGLDVAKALRPLGYDVLAVEALSNVADPDAAAAAMAKLRRDGHATFLSGAYFPDPVFADFLRQALAIGYRPVAYEATGFDPSTDAATRMVRREEEQAEYVIKRALRANPSSKVLLYVGFSHAAENPQAVGQETRRWLASRLKEATGIDPLTIDQTTLNGYGAGVPSLYGAVSASLATKPVSLFADGRPLVLGDYADLVDMQVAHPRERLVGGRPSWLLQMGRRMVPVPTHLLPSSGRRLVQAFIASENDGVPVDQVVVTAGTPAPVMMLPRQRVRFTVQDPSGNCPQPPAP